jgi:crossover junction endodeoxyribonuclease RuvC
VRVLGIDPGLATTGYGCVVKEGSRLRMHRYGVFRTPAGMDLSARLLSIHGQFRDLVAEWQPEAIAMEELFFSNNAKTAFLVGQARGVLLLGAGLLGLSVASYTPPQIKLSVTGYGKADKQQIQDMVKRLLGLSDIPKPDDAADALAIAICHIHSAKLKSLT